MTIHVQLSPEAGPSTSTPPSSFATPATDADDTLRQVVSRIRNGKKMVVVSGAGVSTGAAIPDFRSASGLFNSKTKGGHSVKDLFHVRCLGSPVLLEKHHELITSLASLANTASPTPFHSYLSTVASEGRLLRCYTQNIDGLEDKAGLSVGIPSGKRKSLKKASVAPEAVELEHKVIPLHGLLSSVHCTLCKISSPLAEHLPLPPTPLPCPSCALAESIRSALSERSRPSGLLRASVVLYGEDHPEGEAIGKVVAKDLKGVDCLVVCGTSLSVPGVKRVVKEMAKSAKSRGGAKGQADIRTIFINDEPPSKGVEWQGLFDVWIQSDVQTFVTSYLANPSYISTVPKATSRKTPTKASPRKTPAKKIPVTPKKPNAEDRAPSTPISLGKKREVLVELPPRASQTTPIKSSRTPTLPPTPTSLEKQSSHPSPFRTSHTTPTKKRLAREAPDTPETPGMDGNEEYSEMRPGKKVKLEERDGSPSPEPRSGQLLTSF
ncbi:hypothetical protein IAR50_004444 [Cryptococcus sp. DSM 104548]